MAENNNVQEAYQKVLDAHIGEFKQAYDSLNNPCKRKALAKLEGLVRTLKHLENHSFSGETAREIRQSRGFSYRKICDMTGIHSPQTIANYESGKVTPNWDNPSGKLYLQWLKDEGAYETCVINSKENNQ